MADGGATPESTRAWHGAADREGPCARGRLWRAARKLVQRVAREHARVAGVGGRACSTRARQSAARLKGAHARVMSRRAARVHVRVTGSGGQAAVAVARLGRYVRRVCRWWAGDGATKRRQHCGRDNIVAAWAARATRRAHRFPPQPSSSRALGRSRWI